MANQLLYLQLNKEHPSRLSRPFATGSTIDFLSTSYDGIPDSSVKLDLANIDLINGNDVLLQISVRRVIDHILLDTSRNGVWDQKYQSIDLTGAFSGPGARIRITATEHSYQISFDDSSKVHTFKKKDQVRCDSRHLQIDRRPTPCVFQSIDCGGF